MISNFLKTIANKFQFPEDPMWQEIETIMQEPTTDALAEIEAKKQQRLAKKAANKAKKEAEMAKLPPKELATAKGEPWVAVLNTHINKEDIRNGFFELDWNDLFIAKLREEGYGFDGDPAEEIVDRWFRDLARNMLLAEGQDPDRNVGSLDVSKLIEVK
jgi:hypothetical protein